MSVPLLSLLLPGYLLLLPLGALASVAAPANSLLASSSITRSPEPGEIIPPPLGEIADNSCYKVPTGIGIPGFPPGIHKSHVVKMLGVPARTSRGYWPNTRAVSYELIPEQVSLGFLFDRRSQKIRQTEAAFADSVDDQTILATVNAMLGCEMDERIKQGWQQVRQQQKRRFSFSLGKLEGIIERQKNGTIYIGIWEADLH